MTTSPPRPAPPPLDTQVHTLALLHRDLQTRIDALRDEQKALEDRFIAIVPLGYELEVDGRTAYRRAPNRSFSVTTAERVAASIGIPIDKVTITDHKLLKARLEAAGRLDDAMLPGHGTGRVQL